MERLPTQLDAEYACSAILQVLKFALQHFNFG
jgi:hypothetical protein